MSSYQLLALLIFHISALDAITLQSRLLCLNDRRERDFVMDCGNDFVYIYEAFVSKYDGQQGCSKLYPSYSAGSANWTSVYDRCQEKQGRCEFDVSTVKAFDYTYNGEKSSATLYYVQYDCYRKKSEFPLETDLCVKGNASKPRSNIKLRTPGYPYLNYDASHTCTCTLRNLNKSNTLDVCLRQYISGYAGDLSITGDDGDPIQLFASDQPNDGNNPYVRCDTIDLPEVKMYQVTWSFTATMNGIIHFPLFYQFQGSIEKSLVIQCMGPTVAVGHSIAETHGTVIGGIALGVLILLIAVLCLVFYIKGKKKSQKDNYPMGETLPHATEEIYDEIPHGYSYEGLQPRTEDDNHPYTFPSNGTANAIPNGTPAHTAAEAGKDEADYDEIPSSSGYEYLQPNHTGPDYHSYTKPNSSEGGKQDSKDPSKAEHGEYQEMDAYEKLQAETMDAKDNAEPYLDMRPRSSKEMSTGSSS